MEKKAGELLAQSIMELERRIYLFASLDAKDRYRLLLEEQPELIKHAKQEYIASYLVFKPSSHSEYKDIYERNLLFRKNQSKLRSKRFVC